jgi:hypothetical protein
MTAAASRKPWGRLVVVGAALALGAFIDVSAHARAIEVAVRALETATVVQYLVLAGVSVFAAQWMTVLLVNVASGSAYLVATRRASTRSLTARVAAVLLSRQLGYLQALFPWVILAMAFPLPAFLPEWTLRAGAVMTAFALGAPLADLVGRRVTAWRGVHPQKKAEIEQDPLAAEWHAQDERQLTLFALSLVGFAGLFLLAPRQSPTLLPLLGAFVAGFPFRLVERWRHPEATLPARGLSRDVWRRTLDTGRRFDLALVIVSQLATAGVFWLKLRPALTADERDRSARTEAVRIVPAGASPALAPVAPPVRLFLVADTHLHELAGARTGVQLDLADALVRVAVRPVELDLLSGFTLMRFARARAELAAKLGAPLPWAHLGDDGDLGCTSELERMGTFVGLFGEPPLVLVPGNHDSAFVGNFAWHAAWDGACAPSPRSTKTVGDALLRAHSPQSDVVRHFPSRTALAAVQKLGHVGGADVVGAFVDTSDSSTIAIAGVQGAVSSAQADLVRAELAKYDKPWVIVFMHHPFDELTWDSQQRVATMVSGEKGHTLGVVSAHTHVAALRWITLRGETLPEFVIGSTTDPPQEAALLEVGTSGSGGLALRVVTIPAVARPGTTCDDVTTTIPAATCRAVFERAKASCNLVMNATGLPVEGTHPQSPAALKEAQQVRAHALLACLDRLGIMPSGSAGASATPLDDPALLPELDALAKKVGTDPTPLAARQLDELACFAWAGAALQDHKFETGWSYAHALDVATDASTVFAATEMTYDVTTKTSTQRTCGRK